MPERSSTRRLQALSRLWKTAQPSPIFSSAAWHSRSIWNGRKHPCCVKRLTSWMNIFKVPAAYLTCRFLPRNRLERTVWKALQAIPYGETRSYGDIAWRIGRPSACRAVGQANNRNPVGIIIPCHRVIGADGKLTGYASGLTIKQYLLELNRAPPLLSHYSRMGTYARKYARPVHKTAGLKNSGQCCIPFSV